MSDNFLDELSDKITDVCKGYTETQGMAALGLVYTRLTMKYLSQIKKDAREEVFQFMMKLFCITVEKAYNEYGDDKE